MSWIIRDCLSGEVLLARTLLSSTRGDLAALLDEVKEVVPVPIRGVISDGQQTIRQACHINCATFTIWMKPPGRSSKRIGMPRPN